MQYIQDVGHQVIRNLPKTPAYNDIEMVWAIIKRQFRKIKSGQVLVLSSMRAFVTKIKHSLISRE